MQKMDLDKMNKRKLLDKYLHTLEQARKFQKELKKYEKKKKLEASL